VFSKVVMILHDVAFEKVKCRTLRANSLHVSDFSLSCSSSTHISFGVFGAPATIHSLHQHNIFICVMVLLGVTRDWRG